MANNTITKSKTILVVDLETEEEHSVVENKTVDLIDICDDDDDDSGSSSKTLPWTDDAELMSGNSNDSERLNDFVDGIKDCLMTSTPVVAGKCERQLSLMTNSPIAGPNLKMREAGTVPDVQNYQNRLRRVGTSVSTTTSSQEPKRLRTISSTTFLEIRPASLEASNRPRTNRMEIPTPPLTESSSNPNLKPSGASSRGKDNATNFAVTSTPQKDSNLEETCSSFKETDGGVAPKKAKMQVGRKSTGPCHPKRSQQSAPSPVRIIGGTREEMSSTNMLDSTHALIPSTSGEDNSMHFLITSTPQKDLEETCSSSKKTDGGVAPKKAKMQMARKSTGPQHPKRSHFLSGSSKEMLDSTHGLMPITFGEDNSMHFPMTSTPEKDDKEIDQPVLFSSCPLCWKYWLMADLEVHASQCDGGEEEERICGLDEDFQCGYCSQYVLDEGLEKHNHLLECRESQDRKRRREEILERKKTLRSGGRGRT